jgi:hypothetical protein
VTVVFSTAADAAAASKAWASDTRVLAFNYAPTPLLLVALLLLLLALSQYPRPKTW